MCVCVCCNRLKLHHKDVKSKFSFHSLTHSLSLSLSLSLTVVIRLRCLSILAGPLDSIQCPHSVDVCQSLLVD